MAEDVHKATLAHEKGGDPLAGMTAGGYCSHLDQNTDTSTIRSQASANPPSRPRGQTENRLTSKPIDFLVSQFQSQPRSVYFLYAPGLMSMVLVTLSPS